MAGRYAIGEASAAHQNNNLSPSALKPPASCPTAPGLTSASKLQPSSLRRPSAVAIVSGAICKAG